MNPRSLGYEPSALDQTRLLRRNMVCLSGLEPERFGFASRFAGGAVDAFVGVDYRDFVFRAFDAFHRASFHAILAFGAFSRVDNSRHSFRSSKGFEF